MDNIAKTHIFSKISNCLLEHTVHCCEVNVTSLTPIVVNTITILITVKHLIISIVALASAIGVFVGLSKIDLNTVE